MKQTINFYQFQREFKDTDRLNQFPTGLRELFNYLKEYEKSTGQEIEFDVIALCCDYNEDKLSNVLKEYNLDSLDELRDSTTVIMIDDESDEDPTIIYHETELLANQIIESLDLDDSLSSHPDMLSLCYELQVSYQLDYGYDSVLCGGDLERVYDTFKTCARDNRIDKNQVTELIAATFDIELK